MINTLGKYFFAAAVLLKVCETLLLRQNKKLVIYCVCISLLCVSREEKTKKVLFIVSKFSFPDVDTQPDVPKCKLIVIVFPPIFVVDTKIIYDHNFVAPLNISVMIDILREINLCTRR